MAPGRNHASDKGFDLLVDQPLLTKILDWIGAAVPEPVSRWFAGPINIIKLDRTGHRLEGELRRFRHTRVVLSPELVLNRRFNIPREGRRDLKHAVELLIRSETPFAPAEVFGRLEPMPVAASPGQNYRLDIVPWWPIREALVSLRMGTRSVVDIVIEENDGRIRRVGPARRPVDRVLSVLIGATPLALILMAAWLVTASEVAVRRANAAEVKALVQVELSTLRSASAEIDARHASQQKLQIVQDANSRTVPIGQFIHQLRGALPENAVISRLELHQDVIRLHLRTSNALDLARTLDSALADWSATVDGTIVADPAGGEMATISVSRTRP